MDMLAIIQLDRRILVLSFLSFNTNCELLASYGHTFYDIILYVSLIVKTYLFVCILISSHKCIVFRRRGAPRFLECQ